MSNGKKLQKGLAGYKQEQNYEEANNTVTGIVPTQEGPEGAKEVPPKKQKEYNSYIDALTYVLHNQDSRESVIDMLKSDEPEASIPRAAMMINDKVEKGVSKKGNKVANDVKVAGASYLIKDLVEMGNLGGIWGRQIDSAQGGEILQDTIQDYIHKGLKDGTIDPIELQSEVEPLLTEEQRAAGNQFAKERNLPDKPNSAMAINKIVDGKVGKEREKTTQAQDQLKALGGAAMGQQQGQPQQTQGQPQQIQGGN